MLSVNILIVKGQLSPKKEKMHSAKKREIQLKMIKKKNVTNSDGRFKRHLFFSLILRVHKSHIVQLSAHTTAIFDSRRTLTDSNHVPIFSTVVFSLYDCVRINHYTSPTHHANVVNWNFWHHFVPNLLMQLFPLSRYFLSIFLKN